MCAAKTRSSPSGQTHRPHFHPTRTAGSCIILRDFGIRLSCSGVFAERTPLQLGRIAKSRGVGREFHPAPTPNRTCKFPCIRLSRPP